MATTPPVHLLSSTRNGHLLSVTATFPIYCLIFTEIIHLTYFILYWLCTNSVVSNNTVT